MQSKMQSRVQSTVQSRVQSPGFAPTRKVIRRVTSGILFRGRPPTRNFAQEPRSVYCAPFGVQVQKYNLSVQEEHGEYNRKACRLDNCCELGSCQQCYAVKFHTLGVSLILPPNLTVFFCLRVTLVYSNLNAQLF